MGRPERQTGGAGEFSHVFLNLSSIFKSIGNLTKTKGGASKSSKMSCTVREIADLGVEDEMTYL